jgi:ribosomal protein S18 acetylase RimI-like enzyme
MPRVEIVEAQLHRADHAQSIVGLTNAYALDPIGGGKALSDDVRDALIPGLRAQPTTLVLLAYLDGEAVGLATCFWGFSTFAARPLLNVHDLAVLPKCRGQGVGRELLRAIEVRARQRGCAKLTLEVREQNARARGVYESEGYAQSGSGEELGPDLFYVKRL